MRWGLRMKASLVLVLALTLGSVILTPLAAAEPPLTCPIGGDVGDTCTGLLHGVGSIVFDATCVELGLFC